MEVFDDFFINNEPIQYTHSSQDSRKDTIHARGKECIRRREKGGGGSASATIQNTPGLFA